MIFVFSSHLPRLHACLESSEVNFRIAVGETIALLYELGRDIDQVCIKNGSLRFILFRGHHIKEHHQEHTQQ